MPGYYDRGEDSACLYVVTSMCMMPPPPPPPGNLPGSRMQDIAQETYIIVYTCTKLHEY